ncbi:MAG: energy transducer TonB [Ketobacter sp.]
MEAVRRWKYNPATRGGQPIDYRYLQPVTFSLKG